MPRYLTAHSYRTAFDSDGLDISDLSDAVLARYVARAEASIDGYLGLEPLAGGLEPHVIGMIQQGFDMTSDLGARKLRIPSPLVPVRNLKRIQVHISNASPNGEPLLAILLPGEVIINNWQGYCEIVALTLTYSLSAVVWELGANPPLAEWDVEVGSNDPYWNEPLYDDGSGLTFAAVAQFWASTYTVAVSAQPATLPAVPPNVYVNGTLLAKAVLSAQIAGGVAITALPVQALAQAIATGDSLFIHDGSGGTGAALTCTVAAPGAAIGATSVPIASFTPALTYPAGTVLGDGYAVNYTEGSVSFPTTQSGKTITADFSGQIWPLVQEATVDQTTYLLQQRALNQMGLGGLEQVRSGQQQIRRSRTDDVEEDGLCAKARLKLAPYKTVGIG